MSQESEAYSPVAEDSTSDLNAVDSDKSLGALKSIQSHKKYCSRGSHTQECMGTCAGYEEVTWSQLKSLQEDFHAKTYPKLETNKASMAHNPAYGGNLIDLLANWNQESSSWRTSQQSLMGTLVQFLGPWPRAGMMQSGIAYLLPASVPSTSGTVGSLLPTPTATDAEGRWTKDRIIRRKPSGRIIKIDKQGREWGAILSDVIRATCGDGPMNPRFFEELMGFPLGWTELDSWETQSTQASENLLGDARKRLGEN